MCGPRAQTAASRRTNCSAPSAPRLCVSAEQKCWWVRNRMRMLRWKRNRRKFSLSQSQVPLSYVAYISVASRTHGCPAERARCRKCHPHFSLHRLTSTAASSFDIVQSPQRSFAAMGSVIREHILASTAHNTGAHDARHGGHYLIRTAPLAPTLLTPATQSLEIRDV